MKNLSLNLTLDSTVSRTSPPNHVVDPVLSTKSDAHTSPRGRRQTLTLSIPSLPVKNTPRNAPQLFRSSTDVVVSKHSDPLSRELKSPFSSQLDSLSARINQTLLDEPLQLDNLDMKVLLSLSANTKAMKYQFPEELHELNLLDAYTDGPANVLNDCIFLYSDPINSPHRIDINDYDLVVNVAKECTDMSEEFNQTPGKQYLHVPWSHTSAILKELPAIVKTISSFDDSDRLPLQRKRKVLVHCQCGVSRSACVIVAYFMYKFGIGVNQAYDLLKLGSASQSSGPLKQSFVPSVSTRKYANSYSIDACSLVCPNMRLIFELMEYGDMLN